MLYGKNGSAYTHFSSEGIKTIESREGVQQGDAMSMWLYSMTIQPLVNKIQEVISSSTSFGINKWYADDGNILLPFHLMTEVLQILQNDGPQYGYFIKFSKCKYLI